MSMILILHQINVNNTSRPICAEIRILEQPGFNLIEAILIKSNKRSRPNKEIERLKERNYQKHVAQQTHVSISAFCKVL